jgi:hypothetical protein
MFDLRRRFAVLDPFLDAEYGSAAYQYEHCGRVQGNGFNDGTVDQEGREGTGEIAPTIGVGSVSPW